jgi:putative hydrolase of the HAD superfamily
MHRHSKYLLWDFDNTLAIRPGHWSQCLAEVVNGAYPEKQVRRESFRPHLMSSFPWHDHETSHTHISSPDEWWAAMAPTLEQALRLGAALGQQQASALVTGFRSRYLDPSTWVVFDDTVAALELLAAQGWKQMILSNHVPELPELVAALGLSPYFTAIHTSGTTGFEKPHPRTYAAALETFGPTPDRVVMVGDSYLMDYVAARAAGLEAVLVRSTHPQCDTSFATALEAARFIVGRS